MVASLKETRKDHAKKKVTGFSAARRISKVASKSLVFERRLRKVDRSDLKADFETWPLIALKTWNETTVPTIDRDRFNRIVFAGMGGSGLSGELFVDLARETKSKICFGTIKDYHIPDYFDERTLIIGMSSSGNTEETLSILSEAHKNGLFAVTLGSGGLIQSLSNDKWNFPFVKTTMLKVPRSSLPGIFYPALKVLIQNRLLQLSDEEIRESIDVLGKTGEVSIDIGENKKNLPLKLAQSLIDKLAIIPLIYSSVRTRAVGLRARQSINENAKTHAFDGEIPELCHNDIVGWDFKASLPLTGTRRGLPNSNNALLLRLNEDDPPEIRTRFDVLEEVVEKKGGKILEAPYLGKSYLARIMSMLYFLDYASYYMAIITGIDPIETPSIELLKHELAKRLNYVRKL